MYINSPPLLFSAIPPTLFLVWWLDLCPSEGKQWDWRFGCFEEQSSAPQHSGQESLSECHRKKLYHLHWSQHYQPEPLWRIWKTRLVPGNAWILKQSFVGPLFYKTWNHHEGYSYYIARYKYGSPNATLVSEGFLCYYQKLEIIHVVWRLFSLLSFGVGKNSRIMNDIAFLDQWNQWKMVCAWSYVWSSASLCAV